MKKVILAVLFTLVCFTAVAEEQVTRITVNGMGRVEVAPDRAVISFGVENTGKELAPLKKANDQAARKAVDALLRSGVARKDIYTSNYNISHNYDYRQKAEKREKVYTVRNQFRLTLNDVEKVGEVITILERNGVNTIQGVSYTTSKAREMKLEALERAYLDARGKAEHLAKLEGKKVELLSVSEGGYMPRPEVYMAADMARSKNTPVYAPLEVNVDASVSAVFKMVK
jgi:hypothetical protein